MNALLLFALVGCEAAVVTGPGYGTPDDPRLDPDPDAPLDPGATPADVFDDTVLPLLDLRCASCHIDATVAPAFIARGRERASVLAHPNLVTPGDPATSVLLTYGAHDGPAWPAAEAAVVARWITLEGGAPPPGSDPPGDPGTPPVTGELETVAIPIAVGDNVVPLDDAGAPGAVLAFSAQEVALGIHLSDVVVRAGDSALAISHPTFVTWMDGVPAPDMYDRFAGVELTVPPNGVVSLSTAVLLTAYAPGAFLSIRFGAIQAL